jgi:diguanylate cyclase (GGDEF)-like protein
MKREALREALRASLRSAGPSHYAQVDMKLATRLGGAMWLIACVYALVLLPLAPPPGVVAWAIVLAGIAAAGVGGLSLLRRDEPAGGTELLIGNYVALAAAFLLSYIVGDGSPAPQLLLLAVLYGAAIQPPRHVLMILVVATVIQFTTPAWSATDDGFLARTAAQSLLAWSLAAVLLVWSMGVRRQRMESQEARNQAEGLARIDPLTGLGNKRALDEALGREVSEARRAGRPLSALVADLDDFKSINDKHGHPAGDAVLRDVAVAFSSELRDVDPCFRWGGDEFVALLPDTTLEVARQVAVRVTSGVAAACTRPDGLPVRISVGGAQLAPADEAHDLISRADADLLKVKESGGRAFRLIEGASTA